VLQVRRDHHGGTDAAVPDLLALWGVPSKSPVGQKNKRVAKLPIGRRAQQPVDTFQSSAAGAHCSSPTISATDKPRVKGQIANNETLLPQQKLKEDSRAAHGEPSLVALGQPGMHKMEPPCAHHASTSRFAQLDDGTKQRRLSPLCSDSGACTTPEVKQLGRSPQPLSKMQQVVTLATGLSKSLQEGEVLESTTLLDSPGKGQPVSNLQTEQKQNDQSLELQHASSSATVLSTLPSLLNMSMESSGSPVSQRAKSHWRTGQAAFAVANALGTPDKLAANDVATDEYAHAWSDQVSVDSGSPKTKKKRRRKKAALKSGGHQHLLASHKWNFRHVALQASNVNPDLWSRQA
jgi:hypothetical protein